MSDTKLLLFALKLAKWEIERLESITEQKEGVKRLALESEDRMQKKLDRLSNAYRIIKNQYDDIDLELQKMRDTAKTLGMTELVIYLNNLIDRQVQFKKAFCDHEDAIRGL